VPRGRQRRTSCPRRRGRCCVRALGVSRHTNARYGYHRLIVAARHMRVKRDTGQLPQSIRGTPRVSVATHAAACSQVHVSRIKCPRAACPIFIVLRGKGRIWRAVVSLLFIEPRGQLCFTSSMQHARRFRGLFAAPRQTMGGAQTTGLVRLTHPLGETL
jgi:hypothetical protein